MPNDNTHTLLPCPFCGNGDIDAEEVMAQDSDGNTYTYPGCGCVNSIETWNTRTPAEPKGEIRAIKDEAASTDRVPVYRTESAEPKAGDWGARAFIIDHNKRMYAAGEDEKQAAFELERSVSILNTRALSSAAPRITERKWISVDVDKPLPADGAVVIVESWMNEWRTDVLVWRKSTRWSRLDRRYCILLDRVPNPPPFTSTQTEEPDA